MSKKDKTKEEKLEQLYREMNYYIKEIARLNIMLEDVEKKIKEVK